MIIYWIKNCAQWFKEENDDFNSSNTCLKNGISVMHNLKSLDVVFDVEKFAVPAFSFASAVANLFYAKTGSNNVQEEWLTRNVSTM